MENEKNYSTQDFAMENVIANAIQIPGVKVDRKKFLSESFSNEDVDINAVIELGPVEANCSREMISRIANKLIINRTSQSSIASFVAGIPGGLAMAATIPADLLQFFGMSLRMAQELSYLYGSPDLWQDGAVDNERVKNQLILYTGVMFGVAGAVSSVRFLSSQMAKQVVKKLPQKALTKTFWYPIVKQIGKAIGVKVTKSTVAKGISKAVPIIGGVISGGINFASMLPMGKRLISTLDKANFDYTEEEAMEDYEIIIEASEDTGNDENNGTSTPLDFIKKDIDINKISSNVKELGSNVSGLLGKFKKKDTTTESTTSSDDVFTKIEKLTKLKEIGAITEEEFNSKKAELLSII